MSTATCATETAKAMSTSLPTITAMSTTQSSTTVISTTQSATPEMSSTPSTTLISTMEFTNITEMSTTQSTTTQYETIMISSIPSTSTTQSSSPEVSKTQFTESNVSTTQFTTTEMPTMQSTTTTQPTTLEMSTTPKLSTMQSSTTENLTRQFTTPQNSTVPWVSTNMSSESMTPGPSTIQLITPELSTTLSITPKLTTAQSNTTEMQKSQSTTPQNSSSTKPDMATTQSSNLVKPTTASTTIKVPTIQSTTSQMSTTAPTATTGAPNSAKMTTTPTPKCASAVYNRFVQGIIAYNGKLLNELTLATAGSTFMFATTTIFYLLGIVELSQKEPEIKETLTTLNLQSKQEIRCVYPEYRSKLIKETSFMDYYYFSNVYVSIENPISDDFRDDVKLIFDNVAQNINFTNRAQTTDEINQYSASRTNITDVVSPDLFSSSTSIFLIASKSVKIDLQKMFKPSEIKERDFRSGSGKNVKVQTMFKRDIFPFMDHSTLKAKVVKIQHQEYNVSLVIVLPDSASKINEVAKKLQDPQVFNSFLNMDNSRPTIVNLYMPFINITYSMDLKNTLQKTTTLKIFDAESPSLNVTADGQLLSVTEGRVKASFDMAELELTGKLSKSAIAKQSGFMVPLRDETMRIDQPFIFYYLVKNVPVLCGVYAL